MGADPITPSYTSGTNESDAQVILEIQGKINIIEKGQTENTDRSYQETSSKEKIQSSQDLKSTLKCEANVQATMSNQSGAVEEDKKSEEKEEIEQKEEK